MKLTLVYDADGDIYLCDGKAEEWVNTYLDTFLENKKDQRIVVGSALIIDFFRLKLAQGVIKTDQIEFVFNDKTLEHNRYGTIKHWPKGYCDIPIEPMEKLLTIGSEAIKKRQEEKDRWKRRTPKGPELTEESEV
jgi:hypothetical protein